MMKKFMILILLAMIFVACDYAKDSLELKPDIEITWINPVAWYTWQGDSTYAAEISEIYFVAENSIDSYLSEFTIDYYSDDTTIFYSVPPVAIYGKIEGIAQQGVVDTFILENIWVPLEPVRNNIGTNEAARALLRFVAVDEIFENTDTAEVWFGIWMVP
jgi:hypothetical protein